MRTPSGLAVSMALVSDETIREDVRRILEGADLESISERKIKNQISEKHGDVEPFKDLIRVCSAPHVSLWYIKKQQRQGKESICIRAT